MTIRVTIKCRECGTEVGVVYTYDYVDGDLVCGDCYDEKGVEEDD